MSALATKAFDMAGQENADGEEFDMIQELAERVVKLEKEIRGFAGGTVYRKSHEHVSKELGALRRYAKDLEGGSDD